MLLRQLLQLLQEFGALQGLRAPASPQNLLQHLEAALTPGLLLGEALIQLRAGLRTQLRSLKEGVFAVLLPPAPQALEQGRDLLGFQAT